MMRERAKGFGEEVEVLEPILRSENGNDARDLSSLKGG
jgi:hypothetical protein